MLKQPQAKAKGWMWAWHIMACLVWDQNPGPDTRLGAHQVDSQCSWTKASLVFFLSCHLATNPTRRGLTPCYLTLNEIFEDQGVPPLVFEIEFFDTLQTRFGPSKYTSLSKQPFKTQPQIENEDLARSPQYNLHAIRTNKRRALSLQEVESDGWSLILDIVLET